RGLNIVRDGFLKLNSYAAELVVDGLNVVFPPNSTVKIKRVPQDIRRFPRQYSFDVSRHAVLVGKQSNIMAVWLTTRIQHDASQNLPLRRLKGAPKRPIESLRGTTDAFDV